MLIKLFPNLTRTNLEHGKNIILTEDEINKLLLVNNPNENEIKMRNNLIIELLYSTGMRVSELCNLPLKSVMFNDKNSNKEYKFIVIKGKGQKERIVPIRSRILPLLHSYISLTKKNKQKYLIDVKIENNRIISRIFNDFDIVIKK